MINLLRQNRFLFILSLPFGAISTVQQKRPFSFATMEKISIAVGSKNPVKVKAATDGIIKALCLDFDIVESFKYDVASGVPDQPVGDEETKLGAINRAKAAYSEHVRATNENPSFSVGLEGGVSKCAYEDDKHLECFAWIAIFNGSNVGLARTASFGLPNIIKTLVLKDGLELGDADDKVFGTVNNKQFSGTVGRLTNGIIDRTAYYEHAVILATIPFQWKDLYEN